MSESFNDKMKSYFEQFQGNKWAHFLIPNINLVKGKNFNISTLLGSNIKKSSLEKVVSYLISNFSKKYEKAAKALNLKPNTKKTVLAGQIIEFVQLSIPHQCLKCEAVYHPHLQEVDDESESVKCNSCQIPSHNTCFNTDSINEEEGIVFLCCYCIQAIMEYKNGNLDSDKLNSEDSYPANNKCFSCNKSENPQPMREIYTKQQEGIFFLCNTCLDLGKKEEIIRETGKRQTRSSTQLITISDKEQATSGTYTKQLKSKMIYNEKTEESDSDYSNESSDMDEDDTDFQIYETPEENRNSEEESHTDDSEEEVKYKKRDYPDVAENSNDQHGRTLTETNQNILFATNPENPDIQSQNSLTDDNYLDELSQPITPGQTKYKTNLEEQLETSFDNYETLLDAMNSIPDSLREISNGLTMEEKKAQLNVKCKSSSMLKTLLTKSYKRPAVPSEDNTEESESQLSDRMRRLSIQEENTKKLCKKHTKRKSKYITNKTKDVILKENKSLKEEIKSLDKNKKDMEEKYTLMETKKEEIIKELHNKLQKLEETMKELDDEDSKKLIYTLTTTNLEKEKTIKELMKKVEEQKKRGNEKQIEIKELKKAAENSLEEINSLKQIGEKETALRVTNEGILTLKEEKIKNLEIKLLEKEENELVREKKEKQEGSDGDTQSSDEKTKVEELQIENNRLKEELIFARHEISVRQEQINEIIRSMTTQITELNLAHMQTFNSYKNDVEEKRSELERQSKLGEGNPDNINDDKKEIMDLRKQNKILNDKVEEIQNKHDNDTEKQIKKLTEELRLIAEDKYNDIKLKTKPRNKKQGIPNKYKNTCFVVATLHGLAETIDNDQFKNEDEIIKLIKETKECLEGQRNEEDAEEIITNIWQYSKQKWPIYIRNEGTSNQEDAAEYLNRIIEECQVLKNLCTTVIAASRECPNPDCASMNVTTRIKRNLNFPNEREKIEHLTLQDIIEQSIKKEEISCPCCKAQATVSYRFVKAPDILCIHYPRTFENGEKLETEISCPQGDIRINENGKEIEYEVKSIIIHKGAEIGSGHYICNTYDEKMNKWIQIDDQKILQNERIKEENLSGTIYLMKRVEPTKKYKDQYNQPTHYENHEHHPYQRQIPCRKYKENRCERGDTCPYLHRICKYNTSGNCKYGWQCNYRHVDREQNSRYKQPWSRTRYKAQNERWDSEYRKQRSQQTHTNRSKNQTPCMHYKENRCRRGSECPYKHQTCQYFENCRFGNQCKFRHPETNSNRNRYYGRDAEQHEINKIDNDYSKENSDNPNSTYKRNQNGSREETNPASNDIDYRYGHYKTYYPQNQS